MTRDTTGRLRHPAGAPKSIGGQYATDNHRPGAAQPTAAHSFGADSASLAYLEGMRTAGSISDWDFERLHHYIAADLEPSTLPRTAIPEPIQQEIDRVIGHDDYAPYVLDGQTAEISGSEDDWHDVLIAVEDDNGMTLTKFTRSPDGAIDHRIVGTGQFSDSVPEDSSEFARWQREHDAERWSEDPVWEQRNKDVIAALDIEDSEHRYEMTGQRALSVDEFDSEVRQYLGTQLWSAGEILDESGEPEDESWDEQYTIHDFDDATVNQAREDLATLLEDAPAAAIDHRGAGSIGHDFALTRNRHGAGFWDRGTAEAGHRLTRHAHESGELSLALGPNGTLILE